MSNYFEPRTPQPKSADLPEILAVNDDPPFEALSAKDVADIYAAREADELARRNVAHRKEETRGVRKARDRAQYVRQQKGHSWILHWLVLGIFTCFIVPIYYSFSPNHYWHI